MTSFTWTVLSLAFVATVTIAPAVAAQSAAPTGPAAPSALPAPATPANGMMRAGPSDYVIGPEDLLQISVWKNDTLSRAVPVRPDGKISLPLLHDIQAAGLTAMQLRDKIATSLAEFLPNPEVSVIVTDVRSMRVSVLGEVQRPGVIQLKSATTVLEAIAMAGGFGTFASPSKITIFRKAPNGDTKKIRFNYNKAIGNDTDETNMLLKSGDVVVVP
ncbi:MAG: polysaccharide biosynthesis/export family protein [Candidatus Rokuibacteriota bacterium]